jgi:Uma2 family endonuclease
MSVMTAPDVWSDQDRALTVEDMENMPDDEFRYELDDGVLIMSPAPSSLHQRAVTRLTMVLSATCPPEFEVLVGPGVNISRFQHRVPDVAVVSADSMETGRRTCTSSSASRPTGSSNRIVMSPI